MSTKFEQLLDYLVNEEMDKANELFHEIVVEKSREIYENLIAEEEQEAEEAAEMDEESVEEEEQQEEESVEEGEEELEDSYNLEAAGDPTDDLLDKVETPDDEMPGDDMPGDDMPGDDFDEEPSEDEAMMDIKNAIEELEAAFAELEASKGDESDEFDSEFDSEEDEKEPNEMMGMPTMEGKKRMTREYVEKVGNDWEKNSMKTDGDDAGAGTGDKMGKPSASKSVVSSGKGKPTTGADASNILGSKATGEGTNVGTKPTGKAGGLVKPAQDMKTGNVNVPGAKNSVKSLSKVQGHGAEKRGGGEGQAVGAGTGDNSVKGATNTHSTLKKLV